MSIAMSEKDKLYCDWLHHAIPNRLPAILTLFNNDSFGQDAYLELHYRMEDPVAHLYFCGNGIDKLREDAYLYPITHKHSVVHPADTQQLLDSFNPHCYLTHVRISGEKLLYLLGILYECQGAHLEQTTLGRDGNFVTLKSFWYSGAEFVYWSSLKNTNSRIEELVWLLADYLPQPARAALQPILSEETIRFLQNLS